MSAISNSSRTFGSTSGIDEMLLQSSQRYSEQPGRCGRQLSHRPAARLTLTWPTGSMHGLRARGSFAVDLDWTNGKLSTATLRSTGGTTARLRYGNTTLPVKLPQGEEIRITTAADGMLKLSSAQPAHTATLSPDGH